MLKKILFGLAGLVALILIMAIFISKDYLIEREVTINKPKQSVFDYVKIQKNEANFNKWWMADPNMKQEYTGTDGSVGFAVAWDSENNEVGKGVQEIKSVTEGEKIDCEIRFEKPFKGVSEISLATTAVSDNQTKVKWTFKGNSIYPMNFMNLFIDNFLGKDLQISLNNLKAILEK